MSTTRVPLVALGLILLAASGASGAAEWPTWRGPERNGISPETGLVDRWSIDGENLLWRAAFVGRSTPIVLDGRVCALGRTGSGITKQETVACWDAGTGALRWEHKFNVYHTAVPFTRVGWAHLVGDPETGWVYASGVGGPLMALDRDGRVVWSKSLTEEAGRISGYGGRTHSPMIDGDQVILTYSNAGWGDQAPPRHRIFSYDKKTGALNWVSTPGGAPATITTQVTPVATVVNGQRLLVFGNGDGWIYAVKAATGEKVWGFQLSKQGINTSVAVDGTRVFAASGDENIDEPTMGRVVAIDATGTGDITKTGELWRARELKAGFASPLFHAGRLYVVDDSANLFALDAATGRTLWEHSLGTVGKAAPVWADGKLYATEVNGKVHILRPEAERAVTLDTEEIRTPEGRPAEIYGSPAIAYGRIYISTETGIICIGDRSKPFEAARDAGGRPAEKAPAGEGPAAALLVHPAEVILRPGQAQAFAVRAFDAKGRPLPGGGGTWSLEGLAGSLDANGTFTPDPGRPRQAGKVVLKSGDLAASARVRVFGDLPWSEDFESIEPGKSPAGWIGAGTRFVVRERDGGKVLAKPFMDQGLERQHLYIGPPAMSGYTIRADVLGSQKGRKRPDVGLIAGGYTLDLMGNHQRLQVRDWYELRFEKTIDFPWEPDTWYTMLLRVDVAGGKATVRGKVWPRGGPEPEAWTIVAEDPVPVTQGSPGLYGYSAADIFFDNIKVTENGK